MKDKQLELFTETDFEKKKTFFKRTDRWIFIDNIYRGNFEATSRIPYNAVISIKSGRVYAKGCEECTPIENDKAAIRLSVKDYLMLSDLLKNKGHCRYNKKIGQVIWK